MSAHVSEKPPDVVLWFLAQRLVETVFSGQLVPLGVVTEASTQGAEHLGAVCGVGATARLCGHQFQQHPLQGGRERAGAQYGKLGKC